MDDPHRATIERYVAAYNAFDVPGMLALLHPEIAFRNVANGEVTAQAAGLDEFRRLAEHAARLFSSRRQTIRSYGRDGDDGATVEIDYEGVMGGETLRLAGRSIFRFRDGLIAELVDES